MVDNPKRVLTLDEARSDISMVHQGDSIFFPDKLGRVRKGSVIIKKVRCCKKNCKKCPHSIYAYARYRDGKKLKDKYIGIAR